MKAAEMIESELVEYEDAKGNYTASSGALVRRFRGFLEQLALTLEKDEHRAAKEVSKQRLEIKVLTELAADRIVSVEEAAQISVVNNDHNTVNDHRYDEHEQLTF
jgi:hypothetical protein